MLPATDLSEELRTEQWLDAWYALRGTNIGAIVDAIKPRVRKVMAFGRYGTAQELTYDPNGMEQDEGMWGIVPTFVRGGITYYPFVHRWNDRSADLVSRVDFTPERNVVALRGVRTFAESVTQGPSIDMVVRVEDDAVEVDVAFPPDCEETRVTLSLYPLYSHFTPQEKTEQLVEFFRDGHRAYYSQGFHQNVGRRLFLRDHFCRMPGLLLSCSDGALLLHSDTDSERGNAFRLRVEAVGTGRQQRFRLRLVPNPITLFGPPVRDAGWNELMLAAEGGVTVSVNGAPVGLHRGHDGMCRALVELSDGEHEVEAVSEGARLRRSLYALGGFTEKVSRMGSAALQLPWKEGKVFGLMPYIHRLDPIQPLPRVGYAHIAHSTRAYPIIAAAAIISGDRRYLDEAMTYIRANVALCRTFPDGDRMTPLSFDMEGNPGYVKAARPSDQGLMVRALLHLDSALRLLGDADQARWCRQTAATFARSMARLQQEDGSFYARYDFYTLEPQKGHETPKGTVNNWAVQLWELAERLEVLDGDGESAATLRSLLERHIDYLIFEQRPSILQIAAGGDEDMPNYFSSLATASTYFAIKYLCSGEECYRDYALQAWKMAAWTCGHYIDRPAWYFYAYEYHGGEFTNQPNGLMYMGGMEDKTVLEAALFLDHYLDMPMGPAYAALSFADVTGELLRPNGALYTWHYRVPNYRYDRNEGHALTYAGVGIFASRWANDALGSGWYGATDLSDRCREAKSRP